MGDEIAYPPVSEVRYCPTCYQFHRLPLAAGCSRDPLVGRVEFGPEKPRVLDTGEKHHAPLLERIEELERQLRVLKEAHTQTAAAWADERAAHEVEVRRLRQLLGEAWPFIGRAGFHPELQKRINEALSVPSAQEEPT